MASNALDTPQSKAFADQMHWLLLVGGLLGCGIFYVFVIGFFETVTFQGHDRTSNPYEGVTLRTSSENKYFMAAEDRPEALTPGCRYQLNWRPSELARGPGRSHLRIVKKATLLDCVSRNAR